MARSTALGSGVPAAPGRDQNRDRSTRGYVLIMLMIVVFALTVGVLIALPIWQSQIQRENEQELIFRGRQYVEAVRLYQMKYPGTFPQSFEDLVEEKCIRRLYKDPMTKEGRWNVILQTSQVGETEEGVAPQKVMIVPQNALPSIDLPVILGVVSSSTRKSFRIYNKQMSYDKWLFYYGQDPDKLPQIVVYGQEEKKD